MIRRLLFFSLVSVFVLMAEPAQARTEISVFRGAVGSHNILDGVALNASAATRTITLTLGAMPAGGAGTGYEKLNVLVFFTHSAATTVTAVFTCSIDGTNYASLISRSITSGASTVSIVTDTYTTGAANAELRYEFDVRGCASVKVLFGGASAGGGDLVDVQATAMRGL